MHEKQRMGKETKLTELKWPEDDFVVFFDLKCFIEYEFAVANYSHKRAVNYSVKRKRVDKVVSVFGTAGFDSPYFET